MHLYTSIGYPDMLHDDLINGYIVLIKSKNKYYVLLKPQVANNTNLTAQQMGFNLDWLNGKRLLRFKDIK